MIESIAGILGQQAENALARLHAQGVASPEAVAESVLRQTAYWERSMPTGDRLLFVRLFSPVVLREEVFLGNVLLNAFFGKAFARAVDERGLGRAELVVNDLESYYFLVRTRSDLLQLVAALRAEVESGLPDLFFGKQDVAKGIYGDLGKMFTFRKSDFEPFPVYVVPKFLAPALEKAVRREVAEMLTETAFPSRVRTVLASIAFFYGRKSGGSGDAQSAPNFIEHLVNDGEYDGLLADGAVKRAFCIPAVDKPAIKKSIDDKAYSESELRVLLTGLVRAFADSVDAGSRKWFMGFLRDSGKFINISPEAYVDSLLADLQIGYHHFLRADQGKQVSCRLCNAARAAVAECYVVTGLNSYRFDNQSLRRQAEKACVRCSLCSYLSQKLLGTEMAPARGKLPQVPKTYNVIFHYGKHDDKGVEALAARLDLVWSLIHQHRAANEVRRQVDVQIRDLTAKHERERNPQKKQVLAEEIAVKQAEEQAAQASVLKIEDATREVCPWMDDLGASPIPTENCALDLLANIQPAEGRVERYILGFGMGGYRMILFVLPQIRAPRDAKEHGFAQRRFSSSRVTVTTLLSFLRQLCGCDGPFYYQSLPVLAPDGFGRDTFYVRNEPISARSALNEYEAVTQLAWRLVRGYGPEGLVRKIILAEKLQRDPLGTFSGVMRDSSILGQTTGDYRRLSVTYREDWKAQDLTEYVKFIRRLTKLEEGRQHDAAS